MNNAQCAAKLIEYADRCIAAYDAADPSDRSAAMKTCAIGVFPRLLVSETQSSARKPREGDILA